MFELPKLPYAYDALAPVMSADTLHVHHDKHHAKYVETLNGLLAKSGRAPESLEAVVREAAGDKGAKTLFNNAAQAWNHAFFWASMSPDRPKPDARLADAISRDFGGLDGLKTAFVQEGAQHFASGWVWLAAQGEKLLVLSTHDADDLLTREGAVPLITCDLWEHAYYLDHKNNRQAFLQRWFDALPNWDLASTQFAAAGGEGELWRYPQARVLAGTGG
jgi:Fe-Mn family superoxide dismutase